MECSSNHQIWRTVGKLVWAYCPNFNIIFDIDLCFFPSTVLIVICARVVSPPLYPWVNLREWRERGTLDQAAIVSEG